MWQGAARWGMRMPRTRCTPAARTAGLSVGKDACAVARRAAARHAMSVQAGASLPAQHVTVTPPDPTCACWANGQVHTSVRRPPCRTLALVIVHASGVRGSPPLPPHQRCCCFPLARPWFPSSAKTRRSASMVTCRSPASRRYAATSHASCDREPCQH